MFPNPYDCHKYYICSYSDHTKQKIVSSNINCPQGTAFDAAKGDCSLPETASSCTDPQFNCSEPNHIGAWPTNNNIFYVCIRQKNGLQPSLSRCQKDFVFNGKTCVNGTTLVTPRPTTTLPGSTTLPPTPTTLLPSLRKFSCTEASRSPCEEDCEKYYYCSGKNAQPILYECPAGTYFDVHRCVVGNCKNKSY